MANNTLLLYGIEVENGVYTKLQFSNDTETLERILKAFKAQDEAKLLVYRRKKKWHK